MWLRVWVDEEGGVRGAVGALLVVRGKRTAHARETGSTMPHACCWSSELLARNAGTVVAPKRQRTSEPFPHSPSPVSVTLVSPCTGPDEGLTVRSSGGV